MLSRVDAVADLIRRVKAGDVDHPAGSLNPYIDAGFSVDAAYSVQPAMAGSLDAVARLEAPLTRRGMMGPDVLSPREHTAGLWQAEWLPVGAKAWIHAEAPTEARARLLAVLRALHFEATQ